MVVLAEMMMLHVWAVGQVAASDAHVVVYLAGDGNSHTDTEDGVR
jgi:hypothetical protein